GLVSRPSERSEREPGPRKQLTRSKAAQHIALRDSCAGSRVSFRSGFALAPLARDTIEFMPTAVAGPEIERLIQLLARLPGLGPRSARRAALFLIKKREQIMAPLAAAVQTALEKIQICGTCGNIDTQNPCTVCTDARRDPSIIVVEGSRRASVHTVNAR